MRLQISGLGFASFDLALIGAGFPSPDWFEGGMRALGKNTVCCLVPAFLFAAVRRYQTSTGPLGTGMCAGAVSSSSRMNEAIIGAG